MEEQSFSFNNESQAAFAVSQGTTEYPREDEKAAELVRQGRHVIVHRYLVYCRYTDAVIGTATKIVSDHPTIEDAQYASKRSGRSEDQPGDDSWYEILSSESLREEASPLSESLCDECEMPF